MHIYKYIFVIVSFNTFQKLFMTLVSVCPFARPVTLASLLCMLYVMEIVKGLKFTVLYSRCKIKFVACTRKIIPSYYDLLVKIAFRTFQRYNISLNITKLMYIALH